MISATLYTDGGARGNPGPAGIGAVLDVDGNVKTISKYIGIATNNKAEYQALIEGLELAIAQEVARIQCYLDSELIVKQLNGIYRVKNSDMRILYDRVQELIPSFDSVSFAHVPRSKNKQADALVNKALDKEQGKN